MATFEKPLETKDWNFDTFVKNLRDIKDDQQENLIDWFAKYTPKEIPIEFVENKIIDLMVEYSKQIKN